MPGNLLKRACLVDGPSFGISIWAKKSHSESRVSVLDRSKRTLHADKQRVPSGH
ncbi:hypothetical protein SCLCIDRAFT_1220515 [Scleroderma citrinum Foug A]|uniref:Uncharacterized protein n=1 Tax=Scleroderma citrinum Foug A TaxID=1036808 RepID=A0A0C3DJK8_9AGAM|nr:hypothetical protein SCLCIDRAFT_1220515 [Scleroderma citrinum Foug A]